MITSGAVRNAEVARHTTGWKRTGGGLARWAGGGDLTMLDHS
jgi:hypothetical protein